MAVKLYYAKLILKQPKRIGNSTYATKSTKCAKPQNHRTTTQCGKALT